jgi:hypothetical protein
MNAATEEANTMHLLDQLVSNVQHGRFERMLSALTTVSALMVVIEVIYEHYKGSFGNKMMWAPVIATPPLLVASVWGVFSKTAAKTILPLTALNYVIVGFIGVVFHFRGVARKPGGLRYIIYNAIMGPPTMAPMLFSMVGGMGLLAALLRREE